MKILLVHNDYGKYSGEEAVVDGMAAALAERGVDVAQLRMSTAGSRETLMGQARGFLAGIYSPSGVRAMRDALRRECPDVVNVHNLFPFISPAALQECRKAGVPVAMTIHNYRLICPTGLFMRDGKPCELCRERGNEWGCVHHNCEHSLLKSIGYAARNAAARWRRDYLDCVSKFVCITDFQRQKLQARYPAEKLTVIPNAMRVLDEAPRHPGSYVAYVGRLSLEKGVDLIIEAARRLPDIPFRLAGTVRDKELVRDLPSNVELSGFLSGEGLAEFYRNARFSLMASKWYEGFPMSILEAAQYGKPSIGPDHGAFTGIIGRGVEAIGSLFAPGNVDDLCSKIECLWPDGEECRRLGAAANEKLRREYSYDVVVDKWMQLLENLIYHNPHK